MKRFNLTIYPDDAPSDAPSNARGDLNESAPPLLNAGDSSPAWRLTRGTLVALFFTALTLLFLRPVSLHPATMAFDSHDPLLDCWILSWVTRNLFTHPTQLFHGNIFYPFRYTLAYSEHLVGILPIASPVIWLTGNPLLAHNLSLLVAFVMSGVCTYLLVRLLTGSTAAGILAGVIFAFAPYKIAHTTHLNLLSAQWMPLGLLFLHRGFERRRWRDFLAFAACFTMQALSSFYYALFFACAVSLFVLCHVLVRRRDLSWRVIIMLMVSLAISGAIVVPLVLPYFRAQAEYGFHRELAEVNEFSASLENYITTPPENRLYGRLTKPLRPKDYCEHLLFPGVLAVVLSMVGVFAIRRGASKENRIERSGANASGTFERTFYVLLAVIAFLMSLGPSLHVLGKTIDLPMPYDPFYRFVPGAKGLRVPARFDVLVMLALAVLAGFGLNRLAAAVSRSPAASLMRAPLAVLVIAAACFELYSTPGGVNIPTPPNLPAVCNWLAQQPRETIIAEIPASPIVENAWYDYYSIFHRLRTLNGYSGFHPPEYEQIVERLDAMPNSSSLAMLRALKVRYLVFHGDMYPRPRAEEMRGRLIGEPGLKLVADFESDRVYEILPSSASTRRAASSPVSASLPWKVTPGATVEIPLFINRVDPSIPWIDVIVAWDGGESRTTRVKRPLISLSDQAQMSYVESTAPEPVGMHLLKIRVVESGAPIELAADVEVADWLADSTSRDHHYAVIASDTMPSQVKSGSRFSFTCEIRNDGNSVWLPIRGRKSGMVGVRIRSWRDEQGAEPHSANGGPLQGRYMLEHAVWPGQTIIVTIDAVAPFKPGRYTATIDLCSEWVAWFGDIEASEPRHVEVTVE